jgi:hypothetical protein
MDELEKIQKKLNIVNNFIFGIVMYFLIALFLLFMFVPKVFAYEVGGTGPEGGTVTDISTTEEVTSVEYVLRADGFEEEITTTLITSTIIEDVQSTTSSTVSSTTTETITSSNYVDDSNTTTSSTNISIPGSTYGLDGADFSTGGQQLGGGSLTYNFSVDTTNDIDMILYGATVYSHSSNASIPLCSQTSGDCKDQFKITVRLYDNGSLVNSYTHNYTDINWAGSQNYSWTQDVSGYFFNTASMELYGMDAGYYSGYYGPGFSDAYFQTQYDQTVTIIQTIESIVTNSVETVLTEYQESIIETYLGNPATDVSTVDDFGFENMSMEVTVDSPMAMDSLSDFSMDLGGFDSGDMGDVAMVEMDGGVEEMPDIDMNDAGGPEIEMDMGGAEPEMEMDMGDAGGPEMEAEVDAGPEMEAEVEAGPETSPTQQAKSESKSEEKSNKTEEKSEGKVTMKTIIAAQAADKAVSDVVSKLTQENQMRVIATLGADLRDVINLRDAQFYSPETIYINNNIKDLYGVAFSRAHDYLHDQMVEEQYKTGK